MKKILQILSVLLLSCLAVVLFGVANHQEAKADDCGAINKYNFINASVIKYCGGGDYYYSPALTAANSAAGSPIFVKGTFDTNTKIFTPDSSNQVLQIITNPNDAAQTLACIGVKGGAQSPCDSDNNLLGVQQAKSVVPELKDYCAVTQTGSCKDITNGQTVSNPKTPFTDKIGEIQGAQAKVGQDGDCIDNPLSFFLCPLYSAIGETVDGLSKFLVDQLTIESLTGQDAGSNGGITGGFNRLRNVANSVYILIFLIIIFSNFVNFGLENYTVKKLLPRLIAAIILTQFAFLICTLLVDFSNVLLATIPSIIQGANPKSLGESVQSNFATLVNQQGTNGAAAALNGLVTGMAYFVLILILAVLALVIIIIALAYIVFRNIFLIILVFLSPLAIAAWVLPQTQTYAKKWFTWFIKLLLMGPIIGLILSVVVVVQQIFQSSNNKFLLAISVFVPFFGLAIIPKSLKWSGDVMSATGSLVTKSAVGKAAGGAVKKSAKEGTIAEKSGKAIESFGKRTGSVALEARGAQLSKVKAGIARERISKLSLDRQIELASKGKGNSKALAQAAINEKRQQLLNYRNLDGQQLRDLERLHGKSDADIAAQYGLNIEDGKVKPQYDNTGQLIAGDPNNVSYNNPYWNSGGQTGPQPGTGTNTATPAAPTPPAGATPGGGGGGRPAPAAAPGGTGTSGTATPGTGAGPGQARSSAAQFNRGARAGRAATGSSAAPLSNPNATPPPNPAGGPPGGGGTPPAPPAGPPPGFPGP
ncbi:MAG: hypothetical protein U0516_00225 [Candidatus Saccharibacteria bacterium]